MVTTVDDLPVLPAIVHGTVSHRRRGAVEHGFHHRLYQWLVDLDRIPRLPWYLRPVARFDARDHMGGTGPNATPDIKTNVERFLALHGHELGAGGRIVMLANARVFGHVFDPLTVFWCFGTGGTLQCLVAEVHNTYGERHAYLLTPDADGTAHVDKRLYVSPFYEVSGQYAMRFTLAEHDLRVSISLIRAGRTEFDAVLSGATTPATPRTVARFALRMPAMSQKVSVLIRAHGIALWARRLPVIDRPRHRCQEGV